MNRQPKVVVENLPEDATLFVANLLKSIVCESVSRRGHCHAALSGGTTPHALYQLLAGGALSGEVPWDKVDVFFSDERDVPHDDIHSNFGMVQRTLLDYLPVNPGNVHPMAADAEDIHAAADQYERTIRRVAPAAPGGIPQLDVILLGMGGDGHTASLFPCTPEALAEGGKLVVAHFVPALGRSRMTLTLPLINAARNVVMLVTGADKADAVAAVLGGSEEARKDIPAARVDPTDGVLFLVLDAAAAKGAGLRPGA